MAYLLAKSVPFTVLNREGLINIPHTQDLLL